jgi:membrane-bound metal-dependent hydrolase YbcI (DUF457 family)
MPSPLGHALGGIAAAWAIDLVPGRRVWRTAAGGASLYDQAGGSFTLFCAGLAVLPDADLLFGVHRTATHSISAAVLVTIVAAVVTGRVTRDRAVVHRVALTCGAAYATHLLLDWLAADRYSPYGIQLWWPFSGEWLISGLDVFPQTERHRLWSAASMRTNLNAFVCETATLLPIVVALWVAKLRLERHPADSGPHITAEHADTSCQK